MRTLLMSTVAAIAWIAPVAALAQDQSAQPPVAAGDSTEVPAGETPGSSSDVTPTTQTNGLAEIVVTAQRRSESSQRAAIAIDVVGGSDLVAGGITNPAELNAIVPALIIQRIGPNNASFIRGVGNFSVGVTSDPTIAFNIDGVYIGRVNATSGTFFDLDRIEVLKGPQGTLYGRNATGGVINVLPTQPKLGQSSGYANASYGNYNALLTEGAVNVPVGARSAVRLSATLTDRDGYLSDGSSDSKTYGFRGQFKTELTPDLTVRLAGDFTHLGGNGQGLTFLNTQVLNRATGQFVVTPTGLSRSNGPGSAASQAFFTSLPTGPVGTPGIAGRRRDPFPDLFQDSDFYGFNADIIYDAGFGTLSIIPAVRWNDVRNRGPAGGFPIAVEQDDMQYSLEARFAGKIGLFDYTLGAFYFNEENELNSGTLTFGASTAFAAPTKLKTESYAPFARLTANITDQLRLVGGVRYTHDRRSIDARTVTINVGCNPRFTCPDIVLPTSVSDFQDLPFTIPAAGATIPGSTPNSFIRRGADVIFDNGFNDGKITYRGAAEYDLAPASLIYASVETGFRSGGFNTAVGFETYDPEFITAYTLGSKNRFLNNRVQLNIEAFYWKYRNQQVAHPGIDLVGRANSITENIGRSTIKGVEVDGRVLVTPNTVLSSTVAYLDAQNKDFTYQVPAFLTPFTGCNVSPSARAGLVDINCAGLPAFNSPKWTVNLAGQQTIPIGGYDLVLGVDTQYRAKRFVGFEYQPGQLQSSSWTTNAQVAFGPNDDRWSVGAFVRNIENDRLLAAAIAFGGTLAGYTTPPRTYGVRGSVKF